MMSGNDLVLGPNEDGSGVGEGRVGRWFKDGLNVEDVVLGEADF